MKIKFFYLFILVLWFPHTAFSAPTSGVRIVGNLDSSASIVTVPVPTSFAALSAAANFSTFFNVVDSLNANHSVTVYFFHIANLSYSAEAFVDGSDVGGTAGAPAAIGSGIIVFGASGNRPSVPTVDFSATAAWANGSSASSISFLFNPLTSFAEASNISAIDLSGDASCAGFSACIDQNFSTVVANCAASATSCSFASTDLVVTPSDIADAAIALAGCEGRAFRRRAQCRTCYEHARQKISRSNSRLFGRFLIQAAAEVRTRRDATCR